MTLCIVARSTADDSLVAVSDRMISFGEWVSGEMGFKKTFVGPRWRTLFAGNDISPVLPIIRRVRSYLDPLFWGGTEPVRTPEEELRRFRCQTLEAVTRAFAQAYQEELKLAAADQHLGRYGLSVDDFRRVGLSQFGRAEFRRLNRLIQRTKFDLHFLVYGFGAADLPHIFLVTNPGTIEYHDYYGFGAIGSGQIIACDALVGKLPNVTAEVIYRTCEAKFLAERALGVGPKTAVTLLSADGDEKELSANGLVKVKQIWQRKGQPRIPTSALGAIEDAVAHAGSMREHLAQFHQELLRLRLKKMPSQDDEGDS